MSVLVLHCTDMDRVKKFFEDLGLDFVPEKHGKGPDHFASQNGDLVLEVYPSRNGEDTFMFFDG